MVDLQEYAEPVIKIANAISEKKGYLIRYHVEDVEIILLALQLLIGANKEVIDIRNEVTKPILANTEGK